MSLKDRVDDSVYAGHVDKADHWPRSPADFHETALSKCSSEPKDSAAEYHNSIVTPRHTEVEVLASRRR